MRSLKFLFASSLVLLACGRKGGESDLKVVQVLDGRNVAVIYGNQDLVNYKVCTDSTKHLGVNCDAAYEEKTLSNGQYLAAVQNTLGGGDMQQYAGVEASTLIGSEISTTEAILSGSVEPEEANNLRARLTLLKQLQAKAKQADDLVKMVTAPNTTTWLGQGHLYVDTLKDPFKDEPLVWTNPTDKLSWQYLNKEMVWFDAADQKRVRDIFDRHDPSYKRGCRAKLGPKWRLATKVEAESALNGGVKLSQSFRRNNFGTFWTADTVTTPSGLVYAVSYDITNRISTEQNRWQHANGVCVAKL